VGEGGYEVWMAFHRRLVGNKRAGRIENRENTHRLIIISRSNFYFQADKCARGFYVKSDQRSVLPDPASRRGSGSRRKRSLSAAPSPEDPRAFRTARAPYAFTFASK